MRVIRRTNTSTIVSKVIFDDGRYIEDRAVCDRDGSGKHEHTESVLVYQDDDDTSPIALDPEIHKDLVACLEAERKAERKRELQTIMGVMKGDPEAMERFKEDNPGMVMEVGALKMFELPNLFDHEPTRGVAQQEQPEPAKASKRKFEPDYQVLFFVVLSAIIFLALLEHLIKLFGK